MKQFLEAVVIF